MKLSTKGIYGLEALIILATHPLDEYVSIQQIATHRDLSTKYLEQLFFVLKQHQIIESSRGKQGGYRFLKHPSTITANHVLTALEGNLDPNDCVSNECSKRKRCKSKQLYLQLKQELDLVLSNYTIEELAFEYQKHIKQIDFVI